MNELNRTYNFNLFLPESTRPTRYFNVSGYESTGLNLYFKVFEYEYVFIYFDS